MDKWVDIDDEHKPDRASEVLIRIPVCDRFVIESARYKGGNQFVGAWCDTRGDRTAYKVTHWQPLPDDPENLE